MKATFILILKETKRKYFKYLLIGLPWIGSWFIGSYIGVFVFHHTQDYKIFQFEKDFAETNKPAKEIYDEGLKLVANASSPDECIATTSAIWSMMMSEANKESDMTHLDVVTAAHDDLWKYCK